MPHMRILERREPAGGKVGWLSTQEEAGDFMDLVSLRIRV